VSLIFLLPSWSLANQEHRTSSHQITQEIKKILTQFGENVNIGILVENVGTGKIIFEKNSDRHFLPASNQKLFTAWTALNTLDPHDGAVGSRYIYHTPQEITTLLRTAYVSPQSAFFMAALAVSDVDGTLKDRLKSPATRAKIQAKTGTMSGYLETRKKHQLVFSIMINGFIDSPDKYKALEDGLCTALIEIA
jgi:D-alanyl-D-alanine carboxypeptidase